MAINAYTARLLIGLSAAPVLLAASLPVAHADTVAYLVNVTVRPGYNFPNVDAALSYGYGICGKVAQQRSYPDNIADVKTDFANEDEYQAMYLINQAINELCPAQIWQLRQSAQHYQGPTPSWPARQGLGA
jgi:hypothetical protein